MRIFQDCYPGMQTVLRECLPDLGKIFLDVFWQYAPITLTPIVRSNVVAPNSRIRLSVYGIDGKLLFSSESGPGALMIDLGMLKPRLEDFVVKPRKSKIIEDSLETYGELSVRHAAYIENRLRNRLKNSHFSLWLRHQCQNLLSRTNNQEDYFNPDFSSNGPKKITFEVRCDDDGVMRSLKMEGMETIDLFWSDIIYPESLHRPFFDAAIKWRKVWYAVQTLEEGQIAINPHAIWKQYQREMRSFEHLIMK
ncbi:MAG: hypothetical protein PHP25_03105 [Candidatus Moranbacteria bacterium]|nr:hypothetical protein [Candidatus Moranbacteria bacterium]